MVSLVGYVNDDYYGHFAIVLFVKIVIVYV